MGKRIRAQKFGRTPRRRAPGHRYTAEVKHPRDYNNRMFGTVVDIVHDVGRNAPLAKIKYDDGKINYIIAPLNLKVNDKISHLASNEPKTGNSLLLKDVQEGTLVYNVESTPGDGGKIARSAGNFCRVITQSLERTIIQLPSGVFRTLSNRCRATIGVVAGAGRSEKPFVNAGKKYYAMSARNRLWPVVKGVNMNPVDHPFGGGAHPHLGKPKTVSRHAPPGRKVGSIAARRTGYKR